MYKIGIDTSTTNTAVVILDLHNNLVRFKLESPKDRDIIVRSAKIAEEITESFAMLRKEDCVIGIEGASFGSIGKKDKLVMLMGYVYYHLMVEGFNIKMLPPSTIKKQFTGNGRASKEDIIDSVPKGVVAEFREAHKKVDDLCDAYAIASIL